MTKFEQQLREAVENPKIATMVNTPYRTMLGRDVGCRTIVEILDVPAEAIFEPIMRRLGDEYRKRGFRFEFSESFAGDVLHIRRPKNWSGAK